jgi:pentapeptide MXKDX repeat protein
MKNQNNRWWLAASLVLSLGMTPLALAQEGKTGGMESEHMMEQKGDAMKEKGTKKDTDAMKKDSMKRKSATKDQNDNAMKDQNDKMGKH